MSEQDTGTRLNGERGSDSGGKSAGTSRDRGAFPEGSGSRKAVARTVSRRKRRRLEEQIVLRQEEQEQAREDGKHPRMLHLKRMHLKPAGMRQQAAVHPGDDSDRLSAGVRTAVEEELKELDTQQRACAETAEDIAAKQAQHRRDLEQTIADYAGHFLQTALRGEIETLTQEKEQKDKVHKQVSLRHVRICQNGCRYSMGEFPIECTD